MMIIPTWFLMIGSWLASLLEQASVIMRIVICRQQNSLNISILLSSGFKKGLCPTRYEPIPRLRYTTPKYWNRQMLQISVQALGKTTIAANRSLLKTKQNWKRARLSELIFRSSQSIPHLLLKMGKSTSFPIFSQSLKIMEEDFIKNQSITRMEATAQQQENLSMILVVYFITISKKPQTIRLSVPSITILKKKVYRS